MAIRHSATKRHGLPMVVRLRLTPTPVQAEAPAAAVSLWTPTGRVTVPYTGRPEDLKAVDTLPVAGNGHVRTLRERRHRQRCRMQKKGTSAARRVPRRLSGREHRMMTDLNHQISKFVVREAERTGRGVALEDLQGIRDTACP
ncbi:hypothetical protein [Nonomuraea sp. NPDC048901]|uniref:hypothetical protein n=1 Tax=unclassified Nonomuraea TaxID=2593643 RepID=UPI0033CE1BB4